MKDLNSGFTSLYKDINATSYTITNLRPNTEYVIKAAAYTSSRGPWSSEFKGTSLKTDGGIRQPTILWSAAEGLLKSDATGENVETIMHRSMIKNSFFSNTAWYGDQLYLVTNTSHIFWYNTSSHVYKQLMDVESVGSIAIDWIGKKLYWSNPKQQLVSLYVIYLLIQ